MSEVDMEAGAPVAGRLPMRDRIVEVAAQLLVTQGRESVSTRAVAAAAGTQPPTIYRLFGDKAGLLAAVAERGYASYLAAKPRLGTGDDLDAGVTAQTAGDPVAELRAGWDLHVAFGLTNPELFALMYGDPQPGRPSVSAVAALRILALRIHAIAASGRLRVSEQLATDMVHAAATGVVMTLLAVAPEARSVGLADAAFEAVIHAITTDDPQGRSGGEPGMGSAVAAAAAITLRAQLPGLTSLTSGERQLLDEWLARLVD